MLFSNLLSGFAKIDFVLLCFGLVQLKLPGLQAKVKNLH